MQSHACMHAYISTPTQNLSLLCQHRTPVHYPGYMSQCRQILINNIVSQAKVGTWKSQLELHITYYVRLAQLVCEAVWSSLAIVRFQAWCLVAVVHYFLEQETLFQSMWGLGDLGRQSTQLWVPEKHMPIAHAHAHTHMYMHACTQMYTHLVESADRLQW